MKKFILFSIASVMMLTACNDKQKQLEAEQAQAQAQATRDELVAAVADRDQLLDLVTEISSGMDQIKQLENILTVNTSSETPSQRDQIQADIAAIQKTLAERRQKLQDIESKLAKSNSANKTLQQTITTLRAQIDSQTEEINQLRMNLGQAKETIENLGNQIDSLNSSVRDVTAALDSSNAQNEELTNELNLCYYAIGTKKELKDNKIIETGFLRKTKIMEGDFDREFFTVADKRTLTTLDLNSDKAEVLTNQPAGSYVISDVNGHKVLRITNPAAFWSLSNYLVVKID